MEQARETARKQETVWRVWIDNRQKVVSFHEKDGAGLMEVRSQDLCWSCVTQYAGLQYRYQ